MYYAIKVVSEKPERRAYQRVKIENDLTVEDSSHHKYETHINDISRSGISFVAPEEFKNNPSKGFNVNIEGETDEIELLGCQDNKNGEYVCKSIFKTPFSLVEMTKKYIEKLNKYVKFAYKKPDKWDDYFEDDDIKK